MIKCVFHKEKLNAIDTASEKHFINILSDQLSWSKTRIFAASTITQYWLDNTIIIIFFSENTTIIYWMKETNTYFIKIASKALVRIQQKLYTAFEWRWRSNLQNFNFRDKSFLRK